MGKKMAEERRKKEQGSAPATTNNITQASLYNNASMTQAACFSNIVSMGMNLTQPDFLNRERKKQFDTAYKNAQKDMGSEFEKPGVAKEYKERHYYIKEHKNLNYENPL